MSRVTVVNRMYMISFLVMALPVPSAMAADEESAYSLAQEICTELTLASLDSESTAYHAALFNRSSQTSDALSPDGRFRLSVNNDGSVTLTEVETNDNRVLDNPVEDGLCGTWGCQAGVKNAVFSNDGQIAITSSSFRGGPTTIWNTVTWEKIQDVPEGAFVLSPSGKYLAIFESGSKFGDALHIMDITTGKSVGLSGRYWIEELDTDGYITEGTGLRLNDSIEWYSGGVNGFAFTDDNVLVTKIGFKTFAIFVPDANLLTGCAFATQVAVSPIHIPESYKHCESPYPTTAIEAIGEYFGMNGSGIYQFYCVMKNAILKKDKNLLSGMVAYPIDVTIGGKAQRIYSAEQFILHYDDIVNSRIRTTVEEQRFDRLFYKSTGIMVGNGELWFSGQCKIEANTAAPGEGVYNIIKNALPASDTSAYVCNYYLAIRTFHN